MTEESEPALVLKYTFSSSTTYATGGPRLVYLLLEVLGSTRLQTLSSNLGFVIDTSESMRIRMVTDRQFKELVAQGQAKEVITDGVPAYQLNSIPGEWISKLPRRIDYVAEALDLASEYLRSNDCFSLVAFAGEAIILIPSTSGIERGRLQQAGRELEYLQLGDGTQMAHSLSTALEEIQHCSDASHASRMILLTDGHTQNVSDCYQWAEKARQAGVKLSTVGIGTEFNEDLLIPLADITGGTAHYVESAGQIPDVIRKELGAASRIRCKEVEIKIQLASGVEMRQVYRIFPELGFFDKGPEMDNSFALLIGDYDPSEPIVLLIELILPPSLPGSYRVAQSVLVWEEPGTKPEMQSSRKITRQDILVQRSDIINSQFDDRILKIVEKVGAFKLGTLALEAAHTAGHNHNPEQSGHATMRLRQAATRLLELGESSLAQSMFNQASIIEEGGILDAEAAKKMRYETRRLTQRL